MFCCTLTRKLASLFFLFLMAVGVNAQEQNLQDLINKASQRSAGQQTYLLQYKLKAGDVVRWNSEHTESRKTQIAGELEESSSRGLGEKHWEVTDVDAEGNITFLIQIDSSNMWQQTGDAEPITYDSRSGETPPTLYETYADKIGRPAAQVIIRPNGRIVEEHKFFEQVSFGIGKTVPFPEHPIEVGFEWSVPGTMNAKDESGRQRYLETRVRYVLSKVEEGKAYINFQTEVLTPLRSAKVRSKIMQKMTKGYVVFDIANGFITGRNVRWNETVQEFEGPGSYLKYLGNYNEQRAIPESETAKAKKVATVAPLEIKMLDSRPVLRR